jgi:endonuclease I
MLIVKTLLFWYVMISRSVKSMVSIRQIAKNMEPICIYTQRHLDELDFSREHIVPVSKLKKACPESKRDLHNLAPCHIGLNIKKSNCIYSMNSTVFVPEHNKGMVARVCRYMSERYKFSSDAVIDKETLYVWTRLPLEQYEIRHFIYVNHFQQESEYDHLLLKL